MTSSPVPVVERPRFGRQACPRPEIPAAHVIVVAEQDFTAEALSGRIRNVVFFPTGGRGGEAEIGGRSVLVLDCRAAPLLFAALAVSAAAGRSNSLPSRA